MRVQGSWFRVQGSGFRVQSWGLRVSVSLNSRLESNKEKRRFRGESGPVRVELREHRVHLEALREVRGLVRLGVTFVSTPTPGFRV